MERLFFIMIAALLALAFAAKKTADVLKKDKGTDAMQGISRLIQGGAVTFLNQEGKILAVFVAIAVSLLWLFIGKYVAVSFLIGAALSFLAGNIGVRISTKANVRVAQSAQKSVKEAVKIAFSGGEVMGLCVAGLGLLGVSVLYYFIKDPSALFGFGFGASSTALFARIGGGIYTKAADVGADIVGKIEKNIPEDDPRNPAVIADNVGDNVGDVAGMGADLFESYVDSIIAAMVLGALITPQHIFLPMAISAAGIIAAVIGSFFVKANKSISAAINRGFFAGAAVTGIISYFVIKHFINDLGVFYAVVTGLVAGLIIGFITQYYTSYDYGPTKSIASASKKGAATNIIEGLSVGMLSTALPVLSICAAIFLAYLFAGLYGISIAAVGMLSIIAITLATDAYGAISDNAAGIAEMAKMGKETRERAERLDAVGNTTAAMCKGFAIGSAALTAIALFASYTGVTKAVIDITTPKAIIGLFIGAMLAFLFSSLTLRAVGRTAFKMINEVRRQFREIKGVASGKAKPEYNKCIEIATTAALREMILPVVIAISVPIIVGLVLGTAALGGLLAGITATGFMMAVFMANSGGAWDNAKKFIEAGNLGGKGSDAHKAAVVGDTVGDPFKDTSGPALNIFIKLIAIVALVFAPLFLKFAL